MDGRIIEVMAVRPWFTSRRSKAFFKISILKNFAKLECWSLFSIKFSWCFPVNFTSFFQKSSFAEHLKLTSFEAFDFTKKVLYDNYFQVKTRQF